MSKLNIYETSWTNLVFEDRNKEYGAYHLRQENVKTSLFALLTGVLLLAGAISIPLIYNRLNPDHTIPTIIPELEPATTVNVTPYTPPPAGPEEAAMPQIKEPITNEPITSQQLINPQVVTSTDATPMDVTPNADLKPITSTGTTEASGSGVGTSSGSGGSGTEVSAPGISDNTVVSSAVLDKLPEFPGGINKFYSYVGNNFEKLELDSENAIRITVSFVVEKDGSMTDIRVLKDPGYGLGREAIRVLKSLKTKWSPGMIDGKAVRTAYNLPITIQPN